MLDSNGPFLKRLVLLVAFSAALSIPWLERPFHTRGEPREALVAQAMLATGNWISPPAYDGAVPSKPPFSHWLIATASLPLGEVTEGSARLPSALAFIFFSAAFFTFLAKRISLQGATLASLILISSSEWFRSASTCRVDTILATSMAGALLALYRWWERGHFGIPYLAILLTSVAALTKGPVGVVVPLGLFAFFTWMRLGFKRDALLPIFLRLLALALPVVIITSVWYLLGYLERGPEFIEKIRYENFERFTSSMADEPHKHSVGYLFVMLFLGLLPWSLSLIASWSKLKDIRRVVTRQGLSELNSWWQKQTPLTQFSTVVSIGIIGFFCIPASKRSVYLLPAYPFLAVLLEGYLRSLGSFGLTSARWLSRCLMVAVALTLLVAVSLYSVSISEMRLSPGAFVEGLSVTKVFFSLLCLFIVGGFLRSTSKELVKEPLERLALVVVGSVVLLSFFIYDTVAWQLSPKELLANSRLKSEIERVVLSQPEAPRLFSFGSEAYGASFYLKLPFSRTKGDELTSGSLVFLEAGKLAELQDKVTTDLEEIARYSSGLSANKRDLLVVRVR